MTGRSADAVGTSRRSFLKTSVVGGVSAALLPALAGAAETTAPAAVWKRRLTAYERIRWDGWAIQDNLQRVFRGETPKQMVQPMPKLALPAVAGTLIGDLAATKARAAKAGGQ